MTRLTREQARRVRELMVDEGMTRAQAVAWVRELEPAECTICYGTGRLYAVVCAWCRGTGRPA